MKKAFVLFFLFIGFVSLSQTITTACGTGTAGYGGDNGPATSAQINAIYSQLAVDNAGNLYIADTYNNRIRKITVSTGSITTIAGTGAAGFSGDAGPAISAQLNTPDGIAIDKLGNIYISDYYNYRIRKITPGGIISTICGNGTASSTGDNGPATAATIAGPGHLCLDTAGNLYITDYPSNRIRKIATSGTITTFCGTGVNANSGDGGPAASAAISGPWGIAGDAFGNIYVATYLGSYVRKISASGTITAYAGISGSPGFSGDNGPATSAQMNGVSGLAVNAAGDVFIADSANHRVRRVTPTGTITTYAGSGTMGFSGDNGPPLSAQLRSPNGSPAVSGCTVYINDAGNARIRRVVGITPAVSAASTASNFLCAGQSATLSASGAVNYTWNPGGQGSSIVVSPSVTTSYTVTGTAANGCQATAVYSQSVSVCAGIQQANAVSGTFRIFPNPGQGVFSLESSSATHIVVGDIYGRQVCAREMENQKCTVDISACKEGLYIVKVFSGERELGTQKLFLLK